MVEFDFAYDSFIGGWIIDKKICDDILNYFKLNKKLITTGTIRSNVIDKNVKDSNDLIINKNNFNYPFNKYREVLQQCLNNYLKKYPDANECGYFDISNLYNIQHYPPNGGFKKWHYESCNKNNCIRNLVFMTYLNDVDNAGTEFKYQKIKTKCIKGLTLIWPSGFTHTHRGVINDKFEKFIITGWYNYI